MQPQLKTPATFSAPGKVFLLGEYSVLKTGEALLATLSPRFEASTPAIHPYAIHPDSPLGKLDQKLQMDWRDPYEGSAGFGASSAQFGLGYLLKNRESSSWSEVWRVYKDLNPEPSGADLVAQWVGGVPWLRLHAGEMEDFSPIVKEIQLLVFSAPRKIKTHEHLKNLSLDVAAFETLASHTREGVAALRKKDFQMFGKSLTSYAELLNGMGWEHPDAAADRLALLQVEGVIGVKGSGALLADALIVMVQPGRMADVLGIARERNLTLMTGQIVGEKGIGIHV